MQVKAMQLVLRKPKHTAPYHNLAFLNILIITNFTPNLNSHFKALQRDLTSDISETNKDIVSMYLVNSPESRIA